MSARKSDVNGFWEVRDNPISKAGVFPYLGAQIPGAPDPLAIYMVYRPAEELADPECTASFKLLPWINEHEMLGSEAEGYTPPEKKGVEGVTGEDVYFKDGTLYANLKAYSESLKNDIESGKVQLSAGYRHRFEWKSGVYQGQEYQVIQRDIRGNHLALVDKGRMGPEVAVMDSAVGLIETLNIKEFAKMGGEITNEQLAEAVKALTERVDKIEAGQKSTDDDGAAKEGEAKDNEGGAGGEGEAKDNDGAAAKEGEAKDDEGAAKEGEAKDNAGGTGTEGTAKDDEGAAKADDKGASMDAAIRGTLKALASRDALVQKLTPLVGTFDHAAMTADEVAAYGCRKLGVQCRKGQESAALAGYLQAAAKAPRQGTYSLDSAVNTGGKATPSPALAAYLSGK